MLKTSGFVEVGLLQIEDVGRLTKREMIAAMAMQGLLSEMGIEAGPPEDVAQNSVLYTDALIKALGGLQ